MGDGLLTVAQAAVRSGCSERMLRRAMNAGDLEAVRLGAGPKSDRIHPADLSAFWARRRIKPCQSQSAPTAAIKSPSATADERIARLLGTGRTRMPARMSASGSPQSATLRLQSCSAFSRITND